MLQELLWERLPQGRLLLLYDITKISWNKMIKDWKLTWATLLLLQTTLLVIILLGSTLFYFVFLWWSSDDHSSITDKLSSAELLFWSRSIGKWVPLQGEFLTRSTFHNFRWPAILLKLWHATSNFMTFATSKYGRPFHFESSFLQQH